MYLLNGIHLVLIEKMGPYIRELPDNNVECPERLKICVVCVLEIGQRILRTSHTPKVDPCLQQCQWLLEVPIKD
jgi:hypothetical protein